MLSRMAATAGARHHGSLRSVRSAICALVLDGVSIACVILDVLVCLSAYAVARPAIGCLSPRKPAPGVFPPGKLWAAAQLIPVHLSLAPRVAFPLCDTGNIAPVRGVTLATLRRPPPITLARMTLSRSDRRLLLVHVHPDDESIGTGATMAKYAARGAHVALVTCTLGELGEIIPAELAHLAADRDDQLGTYRIGELDAACDALGVADHRFLGGL